MEKGPDAFRTISEVAQDLDLPQHVLRFWETRFAQIRPMKRGGGRRYYRPDDVDLLRGIRHLLYEEGYTIHGVQRILRERGVRHVQAIGDAVERIAAQSGTTGRTGDETARPVESSRGSGIFDFLPNLRPTRDDAEELARDAEPQAADLGDDLGAIPFRKAPAADFDAPRSSMRPIDERETRPSPDALRVLRSTLQELDECRQLLDSARDEKV